MYIKEILKAIMTQKSTKKKATIKKNQLNILKIFFFLFAQYFPTVIIKKLKFPHGVSSIT